MVCGHQRQGDHHIRLNVAWFAFSDELQIILKCMRVVEVLYHDFMNILESLDVSSNHLDLEPVLKSTLRTL